MPADAIMSVAATIMSVACDCEACLDKAIIYDKISHKSRTLQVHVDLVYRNNSIAHVSWFLHNLCRLELGFDR